MSMACGPLIRTIPIPPSPAGVAIAQMVSSGVPTVGMFTRSERPATSSEINRTSFLPLLFVHSRCYGGSSKEKAIGDELLHDGEHVIGQPIQHQTGWKIY